VFYHCYVVVSLILKGAGRFKFFNILYNFNRAVRLHSEMTVTVTVRATVTGLEEVGNGNGIEW
jgi:hypothetical protein